MSEREHDLRDQPHDVDVAVETPRVVAAVDHGDGVRCVGCGTAVCGHEVVLAWVLGFKDAIRCAGCLARGLHRERAELIAAVKRHVDHRDCWSAGWRHADGREAARGASCAVADAALGRTGAAAATRAAGSNEGAEASVAGRWDAGDLGCGDLVLELRTRLLSLRPGQLFELLARDPGAPADLPAWCGLTGHALVSATPPRYLIRRRAD